MNTTSFTSKATYIEWRSDWKAHYKKVSQTIRDLKMIHRDYCRTWTATNKEIHASTHPVPFFLHGILCQAQRRARIHGSRQTRGSTRPTRPTHLRYQPTGSSETG